MNESIKQDKNSFYWAKFNGGFALHWFENTKNNFPLHRVKGHIHATNAWLPVLSPPGINTFNALADLMRSTVEFRDCHMILF